jgi:transcription initiation factor TFIID TATA-box-binding protein
MPKVEPIVKVENIVASAALKHGIELNAVVRAFPEVEYRPEQFPGLIFRLKKPKTTNLIFGSGKIISTGAKSEKEAGRALGRLLNMLRDGGILIPGKPEMRVTNIVASANLGGTIDLLQFYEAERDMRGRIMYEPEQFPGMIYRTENPRTVILLFSTGKLVCTGATKEEDAHQAINKLHRRLEEVEHIHYE